MVFAILGESKYFHTIMMNVLQIRKHHPKAIIFIGDLGFEEPQKKQFADLDIAVYPMKTFNDTEYKMLVKPLFVLNVMYITGLPVLFMDADAVLINPFNIGIADYDAIVTTRQSRNGRINSGVFVARNSGFMNDYLSNAIYNYNFNKKYLSEQSALIQTVESGKYNVREIPCDIYNYPKVENGIPDNVIIAHLKSGRYMDPDIIKTVSRKINGI
jgi:hypothetical protein